MAETDLQNDGWQVWAKHVLAELERLNKCGESAETDRRQLHEQIDKLMRLIDADRLTTAVDLKELKVKLALYAGIVSFVASLLITVAVHYL
jgi:hypothetical protein